MIGVAEKLSRRAELYLRSAYYPFAVISEDTFHTPLPKGLYVVRFVELRTSRTGVAYPFCRLVKALPDDLQELTLSLSEVSPHTAKEVLEILEEHKLHTDVERLKNLLNIIFLNDNKVCLFPELEPKDDEFLKELGIKLGRVRRIRDEILRAEQTGQGEDF